MRLSETLIQDLRYAVRMLTRNAGFTGVTVMALALGIGVNTATFTAYKAMIARPLDARDPGRMANLAVMLHSGSTNAFFSYADYEAYRDQCRSFTGGVIAQGIPQLLTLSGVGGRRGAAGGSLIEGLGVLPTRTNAEIASTLIVSENYFSVLGARAIAGRTFESMSRAELADSPSVLISENYWQKRFDGDPTVLGKSIRLNGAAFTIAGITPRDFVGTFVAAPDFWLPLSLEPLVHRDNSWLHDRENECCRLFARLAPGIGMEQAQAEMAVVANRLRRLHDPQSELGEPVAALVSPGSPLPHKLYGGVKYAIALIMAAVGMVLVIACANVASLQLARATSRQSELAMRLSLGASRGRVMRQLLTESALLGLIAGAIALVFSWALLQVAVTIAASAFPAEYGTFIFHVTPDLEIFSYVVVISVAAGFLFGLAPAIEGSRAALPSIVRTSSGSSSVRSRRLRDFLIATQVAVSLALLIAGSMLIRSSMNSLDLETGYDSKHVISLSLQFPQGPEYSKERKSALVREIRARLASLAGVAAVTSAQPPAAGVRTAAVMAVGGTAAESQKKRTNLYYTDVEANYFETAGVRLRLGRGFPLQGERAEAFVILSESAAKELWPGENPIGRRIRIKKDVELHRESEVLPDGPAYEVIGIARDTRGVMPDGSDSEQIYMPIPQERLAEYPILIRTKSDPRQVVSALGPVIASIDPDLVASAITLERMLRETEAFIGAAIAAAVASTVGLLGLVLALMGIYGTVSYMVARRTREVGIRMAIGAQKGDILKLMLRESMRPVLAGLAVGMVLAAGASRLLRGVLYGLHTVDGISFAGVSLLFLVIALAAAYPPSRRATRADPMVALRYE